MKNDNVSHGWYAVIGDDREPVLTSKAGDDYSAHTRLFEKKGAAESYCLEAQRDGQIHSQVVTVEVHYLIKPKT